MTFHPGELTVQTRAGVREEAAQLEGLIDNELNPAAKAFLTKERYLAIAGTIDNEQRVWVSLLAGDRGFINVLNPQAIAIHALPASGDPLYQNLLVRPQIGILAIDLVKRRRLRVNGQAQFQEEIGAIAVRLQEAFFNCPKYIQTRQLTATRENAIDALERFERNELSDRDRHWILTADTFFIASCHADTGVDASHRGGFPGFVRILNANKLTFPDYAGNNMFQTLGNLSVNPRAGLLFVDFERGHTLQLTGTATVIWDRAQFSQIPGARRLVEFTIDRILETRNATMFRWQFGDYSSAIPR